jgi:hypothetical protein
VLLRLASLVREHKDELAVLESIDSGKTITDCLHEIGNEVPNFFQWYGELADKTFGKVAPTGEQTGARQESVNHGAVRQYGCRARQSPPDRHHTCRRTERCVTANIFTLIFMIIPIVFLFLIMRFISSCFAIAPASMSHSQYRCVACNGAQAEVELGRNAGATRRR